MKALTQLVHTTADKLLISLFVFLSSSFAYGQVSLALTITDNLITNAFSFDPPKPAEAKSLFKVTGEKGTQVFFYFNATGTEEIAGNGYRVRLIAYKTDSGHEEWFNELTYLLKKNDKYCVIAMNFFKAGEYKVIISENLDKTKVL